MSRLANYIKVAVKTLSECGTSCPFFEGEIYRVEVGDELFPVGACYEETQIDSRGRPNRIEPQATKFHRGFPAWCELENVEVLNYDRDNEQIASTVSS